MTSFLPVVYGYFLLCDVHLINIVVVLEPPGRYFPDNSLYVSIMSLLLLLYISVGPTLLAILIF